MFGWFKGRADKTLAARSHASHLQDDKKMKGEIWDSFFGGPDKNWIRRKSCVADYGWQGFDEKFDHLNYFPAYQWYSRNGATYDRRCAEDRAAKILDRWIVRYVGKHAKKPFCLENDTVGCRIDGDFLILEMEGFQSISLQTIEIIRVGCINDGLRVRMNAFDVGDADMTLMAGPAASEAPFVELATKFGKTVRVPCLFYRTDAVAMGLHEMVKEARCA